MMVYSVKRLCTGFLCILCCVLPVEVYGAFERTGRDARTVALGGGCVAGWERTGTMGCNPAGIAGGEEIRVSFTHLRLLPELPYDLDMSSMEGRFPSRWGALGIDASLFGSGRWSEQRILLTYARLYGANVAWGISTKVLRWHADFSGSGSKYTGSELSRTVFSVDVGGIWAPGFLTCLECFQIGAAVRNLSRPNVSATGSKDARMPLQVLFGALFDRDTYRGVLDLSLCDDAMKISGGIERAFPGIVETFLRIGGAGIPGDGEGGEMSFGIGVAVGGIEADYTYTHSMTIGDLGGNHRMSVGYAF